MTYAVQQDLVDRFGELELIQLTDRVGAEAIDATVLGKALADADELIDSYIASRAALPLATVPARLVRVAGDVARYYLHADGPTEQVATAYKEAIAWLRDVSTGKATLGDDGVTAAAPAGATIEVLGDDRLMTRTGLKDF